MSVNRRTVIKGALAAGVATQVLKIPAAPAQAGPIRVGFLTIKTGPLASGGLQMEQGLTVFFKERNNMLAGPAGRAAYRRHRGQPGPGAHQDAGAGRAPERGGPHRPARRVRSPRHR